MSENWIVTRTQISIVILFLLKYLIQVFLKIVSQVISLDDDNPCDAVVGFDGIVGRMKLK